MNALAKNGKSPRTIQYARAIVHKALNQAIKAKYPQNQYVFASTTGTPINPRNLLRQFKDILQKAGLRDIRFHDLRHTAATFLIARGEHPRTIMDILGHSQISTQ
jgi:integrase